MYLLAYALSYLIIRERERERDGVSTHRRGDHVALAAIDLYAISGPHFSSHLHLHPTVLAPPQTTVVDQATHRTTHPLTPHTTKQVNTDSSPSPHPPPLSLYVARM